MADGEVKVIITDDGSAAQTAGEISKVSGSVGDLGQEQKKTGALIDETNSHSRAQFLLMSELNKIVPGLGHALHAAFAGPIAPIISAAIVIAEVTTKLKEYNKALDEFGDRDAQSLTDGVLNLRDAWDDAKKHLGEYLATYQAAGTDKDPTSTLVKREKEIADARIEGIKKQIEALEKLEEMQIRTGPGTREEKEKSLAEARENSQNAIDALEGGKSVADLHRELATRTGAEDKLFQNFNAAKFAAVGPDARARDQDTELANLREANDPNAKAGGSKVGLITQGDLDATTKLHDAIQRIDAGTGTNADAFNLLTSGRTADQIEQDFVTQTQALANQRKRQAEIESGETEVSRQKAAADLALKNAEDALKENQTRLGKLPGEISTAQTVQSAKAEIPGLGDAFKNVFSADQAFVSDGKLNSNQSAAIVALKQMLDQAGENSKAILQLILDGVKHHETLAQIIADVQKQMSQRTL